MKQVVVVNGALELPVGKLAAQVAHAAVAGFLVSTEELAQRWLDSGMPKIVLRGADEAALRQLEAAAEEAGLPCYLVTDAGRTVVAEGTVTCLAIGPADSKEIDRITGALPLL